MSTAISPRGLTTAQRQMMALLPDVEWETSSFAVEGPVVTRRTGRLRESVHIYSFHGTGDIKVSIHLSVDVDPEMLALAVAECRRAASIARRRVNRNLRRAYGPAWKQMPYGLQP